MVCRRHAPRPGQVQELVLRSSKIPLGDAPLHTQRAQGQVYKTLPLRGNRGA